VPLRAPAGTRAVVLTWVFVSVVTNAPYVRAALDPPPGRVFAGTFHWIDDVYNYLSFVRQAEGGRFVFRNRLQLEPHEPALVNLEWWAVGRLSSALGGRPLLAFRLLGLAASLGLLLGTQRWLRRGGLPESHDLPALLLVATGGGLGGLLFLHTDLTIDRCLDLSVGFFPFLAQLANPHWVTAAALLVFALAAYDVDAWRGRFPLTATVLATVLGLVRPYDLVVLVAVRTLKVLATRPRQALAGLFPLTGLLPVVLYNYWVFFESVGFRSYAGLPYVFPRLRDFLPALAPAAALATLGLRRLGGDQAGTRATLVAWSACCLSVIILQPTRYSLQFLVGMGTPLLMLSALGLSRFRPAATWLSAVLLCSTSLVAVRNTLRYEPFWFPSRSEIEAAHTLRTWCRPGDLLLAPPGIGLFALGLSDCSPFLAHPAMPGHEQRVGQLLAFYRDPPAERVAFLSRHRISFVVLPGDPGPTPDRWFGPGTEFRRLSRHGSGPTALSVYRRKSDPP
jgi:hypothetical protein